MDTETLARQFDEIENKVNQLTQLCQRLKTENEDLLNKNNQLSTEIKKLVEAESKHAEVKALIRAKIESLMARLDGIAESSQQPEQA